MTRLLVLLACLAMLAAGCTGSGEPASTPPTNVGHASGTNSTAGEPGATEHDGTTEVSGCVVVVSIACPAVNGNGQVWTVNHTATDCRLRVIVNWTPNNPTNEKMNGHISIADTKKSLNGTDFHGSSPLVMDTGLPGNLTWIVDLSSEQREDFNVGYATYATPQPFSANVTVYHGAACSEAPVTIRV